MKERLKKTFSAIGWDKFALLIVLTGMIWTNLYYKFWREPKRIIAHDVILYYEYLPAFIIHGDLGMSFVSEDPAFYQDKIWTNKTKTGRSVSRMTMGLAVLYSPFFLAAHGLAGTLGFPADGFSDPYRFALIFSSVFYAGMGLLLIIKLLRKYFARGAIAISVLAIGLGTNLYFYTTIEPPMSHAYSFFLFAFFLYAADLWIAKPSWGNSIILGLIAGLVVLVRLPNGLIFIIVPLWLIDSVESFKNRISFLFKNWLKLLAIIFVICLVFSPQLFYWKYVAGEYFYNSYGDKGVFFFNDPVFLKGMFSYRKGWLVYTPIMAFALIGIIVLFFRQRKFFWPVAVFTLLNFYVIWSWWCWWYGGGFGQRALIESYAVLAIPFTAFAKFIFEKRIVFRVSFLLVIACLICLNLFQTRQYYIGVIHWDAMNKKTYWDSYFRLKVRPGFYDDVTNPDYDAAIKGDR
jgi:hypothetical protein